MAYLDTSRWFHMVPGRPIADANPAFGLKRPEYECGPPLQ